MWPNPQETADLVTFTEEILNSKFHLLCSDTLEQKLKILKLNATLSERSTFWKGNCNPMQFMSFSGDLRTSWDPNLSYFQLPVQHYIKSSFHWKSNSIFLVAN